MRNLFNSTINLLNDKKSDIVLKTVIQEGDQLVKHGHQRIIEGINNPACIIKEAIMSTNYVQTQAYNFIGI